MRKLLLATLVAIPSLNATAVELKPGLWEVSIQTKMAGIPGTQPAVTVQQCYSPEDVKDMKRMLPNQQNSGMKCNSTHFALKGDAATWQMQCAGPGVTMSGLGSMTFKGNTYSGSSTMEMNAAGRAMKMSQTMSGQRIGDCK